MDTPVYSATLAAVAAADHLKGPGSMQYQSTIQAALALARKIDAWDQIVQWALEDAEEQERRPSVPQNDNVSLASYLKYMDTLGLTPAAQNTIPKKGAEAPKKRGGALASVSNIPRPAGT